MHENYKPYYYYQLRIFWLGLMDNVRSVAEGRTKEREKERKIRSK